MTKYRIPLLLSGLVLLTFACSFFQTVGQVFGDDQRTAPEIVGTNISMPEMDDQSDCSGIDILEADIREYPNLMPDVVVWANGEEQPPPSGYTLIYPEMPASQGFNGNWRIISHPSAEIISASPVPVKCVGVFLVGDYISPVSVFVNGQVIYEGFPYPAVGTDRPTKFFYIRTEVNPAQTASIKIIGHAPEDRSAAYVPVLFFGFDLP